MSNSLVAVHPELVAEWSEKNLPLTPDNVTFGSNRFTTRMCEAGVNINIKNINDKRRQEKQSRR